MLLRLIVIIIATAFGFCVGFLAGGKICEWWVLPGWVKEYPHDGQLGLGVFGYACFGGLIGAVLAVVVTIWCVISVAKRPKVLD
jgi:hypothetical protein